MKEYFQNDIKIELYLEDSHEFFGRNFGGNIFNKEYDTRLVYNQRNPEHLQLTIYYRQADFLYEKLEFLHKKGINILSIIKPKTSIHKWEIPDKFDFSNCNLIDIHESHSREHNKKPVILIIDNLEIISNTRYAGDGRFKLTENIFNHLDSYIQYGQLGNYDRTDKFIQVDSNRKTKFGPVNFMLSFQHFYNRNNSTKDINITRDAYLNITDDSETLNDDDLINLGNSLCLLMSLYWEKNINFFIATIRIINIDNYRSREIHKFSNDNFDKSTEYHLKDSFKTFYDFIESINFEKYIIHQEFLKDSIPRLLRTKNVDDISAFMILYNIIEKIRNYFLSNKIDAKIFSIKEEFDFTVSKRETEKFIKDKIKEIEVIITQSDKEEFNLKASDKVNFIKKTGLIDQFENLISFMTLNPTKYEIDFSTLIKIRNKIYHGNIPDVSIKPYNEQLKILIYDMVLIMIST
jgi:hypothetical protein